MSPGIDQRSGTIFQISLDFPAREKKDGHIMRTIALFSENYAKIFLPFQNSFVAFQTDNCFSNVF